MSTPARGRADQLQLGDWNAACAQCGRKRKASELLKLPPGVPGGGLYACPEHWDFRQPQDFVRGVPDKMATPWSQPQVNTFSTDVVNLEPTDSGTITVDQPTDGETTIIINVPPGAVVDIDLSGITSPVTTIIINNSGGVTSVTEPSDPSITVQQNSFGGFYTATPTWALVAGEYIYDITGETFTGYSPSLGVGSLEPVEYSGFTIRGLGDDDQRPIGGNIAFVIVLSGFPAQDIFTSITINGLTYLSASAQFTPFLGVTYWIWFGSPAGLLNGNSYTVTITP